VHIAAPQEGRLRGFFWPPTLQNAREAEKSEKIAGTGIASAPVHNTPYVAANYTPVPAA
jgi:hypothetical protein